MLFNSFEFLVFFPLVTLLFFGLPHRYRWFLLLAASCVFYMYFIPVYILILFFTIIIDYFAGILLEDAANPRRKKLYLSWSIIANVGVLAVFKYYNFFLENFNEVWLSTTGNYSALRYLGIALPIGLSFHTFQAMSYTFEVYYGRQKAERNFGIYALYVMFYPQLVAGPIERPQNILHQFHEVKQFNFANLRDGLGLMLWGLFKKVVIADNLSVFVDMAYSDPADVSGTTLLLASYFFAFQIYCDFSGYSDIAIGAAKVMGYNLMENFRTPYSSQSIREFWGRWHISLSTWFRDYLYIPLGGNRVNKSRWMFNLFFVFMVSGIWHGANWTFVVWGALHGLYLVIAILKDDALKRMNLLEAGRTNSLIKISNRLITFHLVLIAWVFFRAINMEEALQVLRGIADADLRPASIRNSLQFLSGGKKNEGQVIFVILMLLAFIAFDPLMDKIAKGRLIPRFAGWRYVLFGLMLAAVVLFGYFGEVQFIYFQF